MKNLEIAIVAIMVLFLFLLVVFNSNVSRNFDKSSVFPSHDKTLVVNGTAK